jgi:DNA (cytosine-5)-methyltransferase 1
MKLLDLFCCEGGAAQGYADAGFEVTGVDLQGKYAKRYPFRFIQGDAIEYLKNHGHEYDVIHASPPCQAYSVTKNAHGKEHPKLIELVREVLEVIGKPYVIENVVGAPLLNPILLCGRMFNLSAIDDDGQMLVLDRHRLFETNLPIKPLEHLPHDRKLQVAGSYGGARRDKLEAKLIRKGGYVPSKAVQEKLLGIDWMTQYGLFQSIPPVYTKWLGKEIRDAIVAVELEKATSES